MKSVWVEPDIRDSIVDYTRAWSGKTEIFLNSFIQWIGISRSKYYNWTERYGKVNEHNSWIPRDCWIEEWEKQAIIDFYPCQNGDGYRRTAYMLLDAGIVAVSPSSVYRVLKDAGLLRKWNRKPSSKGTGFKGPKRAHEHWHIDVSYINIRGTFYYLCGILDGYSRSIVHWEIRESMKEADIEIILQRALEKYPDEKTRIISDNGPQFIARDFKEFIKVSGMTHVRTSPYYPQSNGKIERWHQSLKRECIRPKTPLDIDDAKRLQQSCDLSVRHQVQILVIQPGPDLPGEPLLHRVHRRNEIGKLTRFPGIGARDVRGISIDRASAIDQEGSRVARSDMLPGLVMKYRAVCV